MYGNKPKVSEQQVIEVLAHEMGMTVTDLKQCHGGDISLVYSANLEGQTVYIKIENEKDAYAIEAAGLQMLEKNGISCPHVLGYKPDSSVGCAILVETEVPGEPLETVIENRMTIGKEKARRLWLDAGRILKEIHNIRMTGFGNLKIENGQLVGRYNSWQEYWLSNENYEGDFAYITKHKFITQGELAILEQVKKETATSYAGGDSRFLHRDYDGTHVYIKDNKISGVIDLGFIKAGDPKFDIAYAFYYLCEDDRNALAQGYNIDAKDPVILKYLLLIAASKIHYRHENGFEDRMPAACRDFRAALENVD